MKLGSDTEELVESKTKEKTSKGKVIILHNDDFNTFEHVERCLMSICGHSSEQAAQCAMIVHYRGKCDIKRGDEDKLKRIYAKLKAELLSVTLEDNE
ncbi:MAG: ATP-dependent Clp protease adapter protein ClpS [uncultured marine phage]|uniref:ATP-dependent Clp protease adapter protein ClpS n=1 Tax=uncultured marine phage TaxID=707152 RepID=A0A8D9CC24_9VIRU|nr:MAG: ATP-dependent Clp protease adapter protein ClpS [uncultured marine phage]